MPIAVVRIELADSALRYSVRPDGTLSLVKCEGGEYRAQPDPCGLPERPTIHSFRSEGIRLYEELNEECLDGFCIEYMEPEKSYVVTEKCYISGVDEPVHLRRTVYLSDGRSEDSSWTKEFDAMGNVIAFASSTGYAYRQRWDAAGNKIWFRDNEGKQQAWRYKGNGDYALVDSRYPKGIFPQQWSVTNRWPGMLWEEGDFQAVTLP